MSQTYHHKLGRATKNQPPEHAGSTLCTIVRPRCAVLQVPADHAEVAMLGYDGAIPPLDMHALTMTYLGLAFPAPAVSSVSPALSSDCACVCCLRRVKVDAAQLEEALGAPLASCQMVIRMIVKSAVYM